ncbi:MAG TPA: hypothetical protein VFV88_07120 [Steroidobacteraceae bacterium]|jgi:hypothetical protein|nr:hypothetical protein [Steroidobacteraceae bacterium]
MCWLIFAGVSGYRSDPVTAFRARGFTAEVSRNPACGQMGTATVLEISDGHCACSLYLPAQRYVGENTQLMRLRYRRKGWSDGRIERAVKARCAAAEKRASRADRIRFPSMVAELVGGGAEVSLLAHYFDGDFQAPFSVQSRRQLLLAEYMENGGTFPEDELTLIAR